MTDYEYFNFLKEQKEKQLFFYNSDSEYENENEISSISELSNSFENNCNHELYYFKRNDLNPNQFQISSSNENSSFNSIEISKEGENKLYFIKDEAKNESQNNDNENSFKSDSTQLITKKKRGRGKHNDSDDSNDNILNTHNKFSPDNILRKIQVHYINFIILFLNAIFIDLKYEQRFLKLDYGFKKNVNKKFVEDLKSKTIGEILNNKISTKYRKQDADINIKIFEQIQKDEVLNKILSENYLQFFKKFYYKSNRIINLKDYGLDKKIILSKDVKMYKDLLKDNENFNEYKEYHKKLNECVIQNFLPDLIFTFY